MKRFILLLVTLTAFITNAQWTTFTFTDEFGDPTNDKGEYTESTGTFTNSATTNSELIAKVKYQKHNGLLVFTMYEYASRSYQAYFSDYDTYKIRIKMANGSRDIGTLRVVDNNKGLYLYVQHQVVRKILNAKNDIKAVIVETGGSTSYHFDIEARNPTASQRIIHKKPKLNIINGIAYKYSPSSYYDNGQVSGGTLEEDTTIDGKTYKADTDIHFKKDGTVVSGTRRYRY